MQGIWTVTATPIMYITMNSHFTTSRKSKIRAFRHLRRLLWHTVAENALNVFELMLLFIGSVKKLKKDLGTLKEHEATRTQLSYFDSDTA